MKLLVTALALCSLAQTGAAATNQALYEIRDAALPGACDAPMPAVSHAIDQGVLHQVPCRMTAWDGLDVFVLETESGMEVLKFPAVDYRVQNAPSGLPDWSNATITGIRNVQQLSSAHVSTQASIIRSASRVPPGLGSGQIDTVYRLEASGPVLESVTYITDAGVLHPIWPQPDSGSAQPVPYDLQGFNPVEQPQAAAGRVFDVLDKLDLGLDAPLAEGRPALRVTATGQGTRLAIDVEETGWADDSVDGQVHRLLLSSDGQLWRVMQIGQAWICARGTERVRAAPCP